MNKTFASVLPALLASALTFAALAQPPRSAPALAGKAAQSVSKPVAAPSKKATALRGPRPESFVFKPLAFRPPKAATYRKTLSNGMTVYIAEDHDIPWFSANLLLRTGPFLEPKDKIGVDRFTRSVIRAGGTAAMNGEQINERMDFLAGTITATNLSIHMRNLDEGLKLWLDLLTNPAFPEDKVRREKDQVLPSIRNRNKDVSTVSSRAWTRLIYGEDSPMAADMTEAGVTGITRDDLIAWHKKYFGANNAILIVTGDFETADMMQKLEGSFGKWRNAERAVPPIPDVKQIAKAGVYMIQPEVIPNQGIIQIGHLGIKQDDPDYPAVDLMNYILGGGSFSSRITKIVRTDNGLAYTARSSYPGGIEYPGTFMAFCQTKSSTVVFAAQLMLDIIADLRAGNVTDADLRMAKKARLNAFPAMFPDVATIVRNIANLEYDKRPADYYDAYEAKYDRVTVADIKRVAQKWLRPDNLVILIGGNIEECKKGADRLLPNQQTIDAMAGKFGGRTLDSLAKRYGDGTIHVLPLK